MRMSSATVLACIILLLSAQPLFAQEKTDKERIAALSAQIERLNRELAALKTENAALKEKLAAREAGGNAGGGEKPKPDLPVNSYELGDRVMLGLYSFASPAGWTAAPSKDTKLSAIYRSPDKSTIIRLYVQPKGAAPPEAQAQYGESVVKMLKQDFTRSKTEVIDPPAIERDPRFFMKVQERVKVKPAKPGDKEKTAVQTHIYQMPGKDMVEMTVITTAEASDQIAAVQKFAEEILLSLKLGK